MHGRCIARAKLSQYPLRVAPTNNNHLLSISCTGQRCQARTLTYMYLHGPVIGGSRQVSSGHCVGSTHLSPSSTWPGGQKQPGGTVILMQITYHQHQNVFIWWPDIEWVVRGHIPCHLARKPGGKCNYPLTFSCLCTHQSLTPSMHVQITL